MNTVEIAGFITGIAGVWLTIRQNVWCFPVGLVNVLLSLFLFFDEKLYSDAVQQLFYVVLLSYGWYNWTHPEKTPVLPISKLSATSISLYSFLALMIAIIMGTFFDRYTDAHLPYLDASATAMSFIAQYLIAKKKIENWLIWIVVNLMYIGIYFYKELYLYSALFTIYLVLAVSGWQTWKKQLDVSTQT